MPNEQKIIRKVIPSLYCVLFLLVIFKPIAGEASKTLSLSGQYALSGLIGEQQLQYHAKTADTSVSLANTAQDFTAELYENASLEIRHQGHYIRMGLVSFGPGNAPWTLLLPPVCPHYSANRITYDHGRITQWFVNGPMGLQHGFTVRGKPEQAFSNSFTLSLDIDSDLAYRLDNDKDGIIFSDVNGTMLFRYAGLMVVDARNQRLPAYMKIGGNRLAIVVDDQNAVYPVTVDPVFQQARLVADDGGAYDTFGQAVAIQDNIVVVGAPGHDIGGNNGQGMAYVFQRTEGGWNNLTLVAHLSASDGNASDWFGCAVAMDDETIVVGADSALSGPQRTGAAYIFVRPVSGWHDMTQTAKLIPSSGEDQDRFGGAVAIDADTVVIGASGHNTGGNVNQGKAYIFIKPRSGWSDMTETGQLTADDGEANDFFGHAVAVEQESAVVSSPYHKNNRGALYVFEKPVTGWGNITQTAKLMASDRDDNDFLGFSVAMDKDIIVAGAPGFHTASQPNLGAAYVFVRSGQHWIDMEETTELRASDRMNGDRFGHSVAIDGNTIVIGSPYHNYSGVAANGLPFVVFNLGAVYSFTRPASGWPFDMRAKAEMVSNDGHAGDHLGNSVAIAGETVVAGAPHLNDGDREQLGAAYVFRLKKKSSWPMLVVAITSRKGHIIAISKKAGHPTSCNCVSTHRVFLGWLWFAYTNRTMPHFKVDEESACSLEMPVLGDIGFLDCTPVTWRWNADENDGQMRIRRSASIVFNPTGSCSKSRHSCTVSLHARGSETLWQWYSTDNGLTWTLVPGMPYTMPVDWLNTPINFDNIDLIKGGGDDFAISTSGGKASFDLVFVPVCGTNSCE